MTLVVIGIGGSYWAEAALNYLLNKERCEDKIIFAGHQVSSSYLNRLVSYLENKFSINVISNQEQLLNQLLHLEF